MAEFHVTSSEIRKKERSLQTDNQKLRTMLKNLETQFSSMNRMWDGEAKNTYATEFEKGMTQFNRFAETVDKYCAALENAAQNYETAEKQNIRTAKAR